MSKSGIRFLVMKVLEPFGGKHHLDDHFYDAKEAVRKAIGGLNEKGLSAFAEINGPRDVRIWHDGKVINVYA